MAYRAPEEWRRLRYKSEDDWRAAVNAKAKEIWDAREAAMWGDGLQWEKYHQTWDQGTQLARDRCLIQAERELGQ